MVTFKYTARQPGTGKKVTSEIQADSVQTAAKLIKQEGLSPIDIQPVGAGTNILSRFKDRIGSKDKVLFSRQLSTLINAGLPLVQSLRNVSAQTQNKSLQLTIGKIITDVEAGSSF
jgi:type IV pilus assembly protein PilC